ncbi:MAG TPA: hypothetical protein VG650_09215 [Mycobacteriales bacterium]|nr:hypothetical protein [Mycobacteriales bacterium]
MSEDSPHVRRLTYALITVSVLHALSPLILRGLHSGLGWDETVYISQIDPHVPAGQFTAPRARGLTLLTAPASLVSGSLYVMRIWMAILSGLGMFLAFLPWLRVRPRMTVPLAAAIWSGLWLGIYYSFEAMPNQYVAYGAIAATGWLVLAICEPERRRSLWYAALAIGFTALMRPSDSIFVFLPLVAGVMMVQGKALRWRATAAGLLSAGLAAGLAEWVVEAYVRFGGPVQRFHAASAENVGGLHWSLGAEMRVLAGPILCRGTCQADSAVPYRLWWFALPVAVALGIWVAWRQRRATAYVLVTAVGLSIAAQYVLAIGYAAPRFLEPTYALLAIPAAEGVLWLWRRAATVSRPAAIAGLVVLGAGHEAIQLAALQTNDHRLAIETDRAALMADYLKDTGSRQPCWVGGAEAGQIAFLAHCHVLDRRIPVDRQTKGVPATVVVVEPGGATPPTWSIQSWSAHTLTEHSAVHGWTVWRLNSNDTTAPTTVLGPRYLTPA